MHICGQGRYTRIYVNGISRMTLENTLLLCQLTLSYWTKGNIEEGAYLQFPGCACLCSPQTLSYKTCTELLTITHFVEDKRHRLLHCCRKFCSLFMDFKHCVIIQRNVCVIQEKWHGIVLKISFACFFHIQIKTSQCIHLCMASTCKQLYVFMYQYIFAHLIFLLWFIFVDLNYIKIIILSLISPFVLCVWIRIKEKA